MGSGPELNQFLRMSYLFLLDVQFCTVEDLTFAGTKYHSAVRCGNLARPFGPFW